MNFGPNPPLKHVALILDGNGRWAKQRGLSRIEGHKEGAKRALEIVEHAFKQWHIPYVTFYTFSTENWKRSKLEIQALFRILGIYLRRQSANLIKEKIRLRTLGNISKLPSNLYSTLARLQENTQHFTQYNLNLALNYGAREEMIRAIQTYMQVKGGNGLDLDWDVLTRYLYTSEIPDPDLIIRTSGEYRLSNFLCMQAAYSEFYFTSTYWPDFNAKAFDEAIAAYLKRERRFGNAQE